MVPQQTFTCLKPPWITVCKNVNNNFNHVVLVSLLLILNIFDNFFYCFYILHRTSKCLLAPIFHKSPFGVRVIRFYHNIHSTHGRCGSRTAVTSKMERFVIIVNGFQPLTIITKRSILDVVAVLDPPLTGINCFYV